MAKRKLRIGVVGLGRIGWRFHSHTLASHRDFDLVATADPVMERCDEAEAAFGCQAFQSFETMLDTVELDAITIASPTHVHKAQAIEAFKRGLHVMMEKPMAPSLADGQAIARAAKRYECILTVYQPHRAAAYFQHLQRIIAGGKIGQVYHIKCGSFRFVRRNDWQSLRKFGGGMLNNYGAHRLDQLLALTGRDVKKVFGQLRRVASLGDAEDVVKLVYETRQGVIGEMDINQAIPTAPYDMEVYGTRGMITKAADVYTVQYVRPGQLKAKSVDASLASADRKYPQDDVTFETEQITVDPCYQVDVYRDLAKAIRTGAEPFIRPQESLSVMRVMDQCRKDSRRIVATPFE